MSFSSIEEALEEIRQGRMIVVVDDEDRENEGDLTMAAEKVTPEAINFMATHGRGLICLPMTEEKLAELQLPLMVAENQTKYQTAFSVSIEARVGTTTGISAADRATTILTAVREDCRPRDLVRPGHTFPLRAVDGGVLRRAGQTEAAVDLARLAGLTPAGVICEIMNDDGTMARVPDLDAFCRRHGLKMITVADLIRYRMENERLVREITSTDFPSEYGTFRLHAFENEADGHVDLALSRGTISADEPVLVRVHSEDLLDDVFGAAAGPNKNLLQLAMQEIARAESGVIVYLRQEGRGPQLRERLEALSRGESDAVSASTQPRTFRPDQREYGIGAQILVALGVRQIRLLTNNPRHFIAVAGYGLEIVEQVHLGAA